jgi:hypothetical protein
MDNGQTDTNPPIHQSTNPPIRPSSNPPIPTTNPSVRLSTTPTSQQSPIHQSTPPATLLFYELMDLRTLTLTGDLVAYYLHGDKPTTCNNFEIFQIDPKFSASNLSELRSFILNFPDNFGLRKSYVRVLVKQLRRCPLSIWQAPIFSELTNFRDFMSEDDFIWNILRKIQEINTPEAFFFILDKFLEFSTAELTESPGTSELSRSPTNLASGFKVFSALPRHPKLLTGETAELVIKKIDQQFREFPELPPKLKKLYKLVLLEIASAGSGETPKTISEEGTSESNVVLPEFGANSRAVEVLKKNWLMDGTIFMAIASLACRKFKVCQTGDKSFTELEEILRNSENFPEVRKHVIEFLLTESYGPGATEESGIFLKQNPQYLPSDPIVWTQYYMLKIRTSETNERNETTEEFFGWMRGSTDRYGALRTVLKTKIGDTGFWATPTAGSGFPFLIFDAIRVLSEVGMDEEYVKIFRDGSKLVRNFLKSSSPKISDFSCLQGWESLINFRPELKKYYFKVLEMFVTSSWEAKFFTLGNYSVFLEKNGCFPPNSLPIGKIISASEAQTDHALFLEIGKACQLESTRGPWKKILLEILTTENLGHWVTKKICKFLKENWPLDEHVMYSIFGTMASRAPESWKVAPNYCYENFKQIEKLLEIPEFPDLKWKIFELLISSSISGILPATQALDRSSEFRDCPQICVKYFISRIFNSENYLVFLKEFLEFLSRVSPKISENFEIQTLLLEFIPKFWSQFDSPSEIFLATCLLQRFNLEENSIEIISRSFEFIQQMKNFEEIGTNFLELETFYCGFSQWRIFSTTDPLLNKWMKQILEEILDSVSEKAFFSFASLPVPECLFETFLNLPWISEKLKTKFVVFLISGQSLSRFRDWVERQPKDEFLENLIEENSEALLLRAFSKPTEIPLVMSILGKEGMTRAAEKGNFCAQSILVLMDDSGEDRLEGPEAFSLVTSLLSRLSYGPTNESEKRELVRLSVMVLRVLSRFIMGSEVRPFFNYEGEDR